MHEEIERLQSYRQSDQAASRSILEKEQFVPGFEMRWKRIRLDHIRYLNQYVVHAGDARGDSMMMRERYRKTSTEWRAFEILYGLTADEIENLELAKCNEAIQALNRGATSLLQLFKEAFKKETAAQRAHLLVLLREKKLRRSREVCKGILSQELGVWGGRH
ncbi:uncharacterized protein N7483_002706 [Penicillium malachiteum]|uniref:uncharacterized protein n=1 Tax=Penicillium malachiteum TaxID=1324776 RepID=UPI0025487399|nr:uncharacterized protein N7483_002706 [Penicillium malachiteum]KAJ5737581.1 hypothetical protein N7483_002706 [Penicillium malachiteum]